MIRLLVTIAANAVGLYAATRLIDGVIFTGDIAALLIAALIFALINWIVRPLAKLLFGPVILLTLGLFIVIINMGMLWMLDLVIDSLAISHLRALFLATVLIGLINLLSAPIKSHEKE